MYLVFWGFGFCILVVYFVFGGVFDTLKGVFDTLRGVFGSEGCAFCILGCIFVICYFCTMLYNNV